MFLDSPRVRTLASRLIVNRTDAVVLHCSVDANPLPNKVIWLKNNIELIRRHHLTDLRLERVERNDSGHYTCMVFNRFYTNVTSNGSTSTELIVQTRPILETTHSKFAAEIGQSVTLICRASGEPQPTIVWKYDEKILSCTEIINGTCYLRLPNIQSIDFGVYCCLAENLLGREEWLYTIVVRG
jgi:hypothetical protein